MARGPNAAKVWERATKLQADGLGKIQESGRLFGEYATMTAGAVGSNGATAAAQARPPAAGGKARKAKTGAT